MNVEAAAIESYTRRTLCVNMCLCSTHLFVSATDSASLFRHLVIIRRITTQANNNIVDSILNTFFQNQIIRRNVIRQVHKHTYNSVAVHSKRSTCNILRVTAYHYRRQKYCWQIFPLNLPQLQQRGTREVLTTSTLAGSTYFSCVILIN